MFGFSSFLDQNTKRINIKQRKAQNGEIVKRCYQNARGVAKIRGRGSRGNATEYEVCYSRVLSVTSILLRRPQDSILLPPHRFYDSVVFYQ